MFVHLCHEASRLDTSRPLDKVKVKVKLASPGGRPIEGASGHKQTARYGVSLKAIPLPPGTLALQNTKQANYTAWKNK